MRPSLRILIAAAVILGLLGGIWYWLMDGIASGEMQTSGSQSDAIRTISQTIGWAMGIFAGVAVAGFLVLRSRGR